MKNVKTENKTYKARTGLEINNPQQKTSEKKKLGRSVSFSLAYKLTERRFKLKRNTQWKRKRHKQELNIVKWIPTGRHTRVDIGGELGARKASSHIGSPSVCAHNIDHFKDSEGFQPRVATLRGPHAWTLNFLLEAPTASSGATSREHVRQRRRGGALFCIMFFFPG